MEGKTRDKGPWAQGGSGDIPVPAPSPLQGSEVMDPGQLDTGMLGLRQMGLPPCSCSFLLAEEGP